MDALDRLNLFVSILTICDICIRLLRYCAKNEGAFRRSDPEEQHPISHQVPIAKVNRKRANLLAIQPYPTCQSVYFIDANNRRHEVHLSLCETTEGFLQFLFWSFKNTSNTGLRQRLKFGEFWLIRVDEYSTSGFTLHGLRRMADCGYLALLADNYEDNVIAGAVYLIMSPKKLNREERDITHTTWKSIPPTIRNDLILKYGFA